MNEHQAREVVLSAIQRIAPEIDPAAILGGEPLREQVELDSMDFLNLLIDLHKQTGVEIPETDYTRVARLDDMVRYLASRATVR